MGEGADEVGPRIQFPSVTWQLTACCCTQVWRVTTSLAFGFFSFSCFFFFFLELLPKTLKIVKDAAVKTGPVLCLKCSPLLLNHQANHNRGFLSPKKTSFHSLMDSSLLCSVPSATMSQGHQGKSPQGLVTFFLLRFANI